MKNIYRTHLCNELRSKDVGTSAKLSGWIHRKRDHGNLLFIDLRDHFGLTQCVIEVKNPEFHKIEKLHSESVVTFEGMVTSRDEETVNKNLPTGGVELKITKVHLISSADVIPFQVAVDDDSPEDLRLKYRFLDLRREKLHKNIILRSNVISSIRRRMTHSGFLEIQTPILTSSSPEGARDYLVPSRIHRGQFYALPQAPQLFKQLFMVAGFDRYFQIAPCFRDEDARSDRSPGEFYQLDFEMSFVTQEEVFSAIEPVLSGIFEEFGNEKSVTKPPFPKIPFHEAMLKYGTDKPDLRNPIIISDLTNIFMGSNFKIFADKIAKGCVVRGIPAPKTSEMPRSFFDKYNNWAREEGKAGLGYISFAESAKGPIAKNLENEKLDEMKKLANLDKGDSIFFVCDSEKEANNFSGIVRKKVAKDLKLIKDNGFSFCWIVDYPMYEKDEESGDIIFSHNPFSMPQGGIDAFKTKDVLDIKAWQYDIVCNGVELSSGAIRNHIPEIMYKAFEVAGYSKKDVDSQFAGLINAFKYGAPPHGGCAPGIDRIVMLLAGEPNIREVIAFPMNQKAQDLLMNAPSKIDQKRLKELGITITSKKKDE